VKLHHNNNNDPDGEEKNSEVVASLIQSTVMSFIATTATEIESLRSMVHTTPTSSTKTALSNHLILHRSGIVQILLERLQREIARPFGFFTKTTQSYGGTVVAKSVGMSSRSTTTTSILQTEKEKYERQKWSEE